MANFQRRRPRAMTPGSGSNGFWLRHWPKWYDVVFHTRPQRRRARVCEILVMKGYDPDTINWPLDKKPHLYYW